MRALFLAHRKPPSRCVLTWRRELWCLFLQRGPLMISLNLVRSQRLYPQIRSQGFGSGETPFSPQRQPTDNLPEDPHLTSLPKGRTSSHNLEVIYSSYCAQAKIAFWALPCFRRKRTRSYLNLQDSISPFLFKIASKWQANLPGAQWLKNCIVMLSALGMSSHSYLWSWIQN